MNKEETICAIATGRGGALGIIRVSGPNAIINTDKIFIPADKTLKLLQDLKDSDHLNMIVIYLLPVLII